jgi:hypothetical protein
MFLIIAQHIVAINFSFHHHLPLLLIVKILWHDNSSIQDCATICDFCKGFFPLTHTILKVITTLMVLSWHNGRIWINATLHHVNIRSSYFKPISKWGQITQKIISGDQKLCHMIFVKPIVIKTTFSHHSLLTTKKNLNVDQILFKQ